MQALAHHRTDSLLEAQARAVEYGQMFQYDQLRPQLLEHMPPLDAAAYARSAAAAGKLDAAQQSWYASRPCLGNQHTVEQPHVAAVVQLARLHILLASTGAFSQHDSRTTTCTACLGRLSRHTVQGKLCRACHVWRWLPQHANVR